MNQPKDGFYIVRFLDVDELSVMRIHKGKMEALVPTMPLPLAAEANPRVALERRVDLADLLVLTGPPQTPDAADPKVDLKLAKYFYEQLQRIATAIEFPIDHTNKHWPEELAAYVNGATVHFGPSTPNSTPGGGVVH